MKFVTYCERGGMITTIGILHKNRNSVAPISMFGVSYKSMNDLIEHAGKEELIQLQNASLQDMPFPYSLENIVLSAPIPVPRQDIICLGVNYKNHARESARYKKEAFDLNADYPVYFSKRVNEAVGHEQEVFSYGELVDSLDYEVELALVIGKDAKNVHRENAYEYIFGYTILNDISARNIQTQHKQWYYGKSFDSFTPMGPYLVTEDEFQKPLHLHLQSRVNGEIRQDSNTGLLLFDIPYVIEELSKGFTLKAGTIISMGTPGGVGMGYKPPRFLKPGDVVECEIEGIGVLKNYIS